jgi:FkbM family methyltransferase
MTTDIVNTRHGRMKIFNEDPWVSRSLRELGEYSMSEFYFMKMLLEIISIARGRLIDIVEAGAFIGDMTIPLSRLCRKLYAFEPNKEVREVLIENLEVNRCQNVEVFPYGLAHCEGKSHYNSIPPEGGPGGITLIHDVGDVEVELRTLDSFNLPTNIGLMKVDIEGMEIPFLVGAQETMARCQCPVFMEFDTVTLVDLPPLDKILTDKFKYSVYKYFFPVYNNDNFNHSQNNPFGETVSKMLLGTPTGGHQESILELRSY